MEQNKFLDKLDKVLSPIGAKIGNQRHLRAVSSGMMMTLALIVVGSLFLIVANPPINPELVDSNTSNIFLKFLLSWKEWAVANYDLITAPYNMTMGIVGLMTAFAISYCLAGEYKMNSAISGLISVALFLLICAPAVDGNIPMTYLGSDGLFVAILIGLVSVEITRFIESKGLQFKLPASVPPAVTAFINSLLPLLVNIIILYGINIILIANMDKNIPQAVMSILTPALSVVDNLWGYIAIVTFGSILWLFGINGTSIIFPILFPIAISNTGLNATAMAAGQDPVSMMNLQLFRYVLLGGAGNTIGLILLMLRSKSAQLRSVGKISIVPGICGINEPLIFGSPIVFNPILGIPFIIMPIITVLLGYFVQAMGFVTPGYMVDPSFTPFFVQAYLSGMDFRNVIFAFALVAISAVVYYPFFKIYEKNLVKQEQDMENVA